MSGGNFFNASAFLDSPNHEIYTGDTRIVATDWSQIHAGAGISTFVNPNWSTLNVGVGPTSLGLEGPTGGGTAFDPGGTIGISSVDLGIDHQAPSGFAPASTLTTLLDTNVSSTELGILEGITLDPFEATSDFYGSAFADPFETIDGAGGSWTDAGASTTGEGTAPSTTGAIEGGEGSGITLGFAQGVTLEPIETAPSADGSSILDGELGMTAGSPGKPDPKSSDQTAGNKMLSGIPEEWGAFDSFYYLGQWLKHLKEVDGIVGRTEFTIVLSANTFNPFQNVSIIFPSGEYMHIADMVPAFQEYGILVGKDDKRPKIIRIGRDNMAATVARELFTQDIQRAANETNFTIQLFERTNPLLNWTFTPKPKPQ